MRRVYPGFLQLTAFMSMNAERHIKAQVDLYKAMAKGEHEQANTIKAFYDEYFAVLDMTAEFYLETVQWVFQDHLSGQGRARLARPPRQSQGDPPHGAVHHRGRARRHLRHRPDRGRARSLHQPAALPQEALHAGRRRPLRRVQRPAVGQPDLSLGAKHDPGQRVASTSEIALSVIARGVAPALERSEGSHGVATGDEVLRLRSGRQICVLVCTMADFPKKTLADWEKARRQGAARQARCRRSTG